MSDIANKQLTADTPVSKTNAPSNGHIGVYLDAIRPFMRWLSHFLVNGFIAGAMLSLLSLLVLVEQFSAGVSRQVKADMAVRVVMELEVTPERAQQIADALGELDKENIVYQVITPQQGRTLLGIEESWMNDLPPLIADRMPIVIELRQQLDRGVANLAKVAHTARDLPESNSVLFNETAWNASRIVSSEIDKASQFPRYLLNRLILLMIGLTCILSGIGLRHRRLWLMFFGITVATVVCLVTIHLFSSWLPKLAVAAQTSESIKDMIETSVIIVPPVHILYLVAFWLVVEVFRLRLRRD